MTKCKHVECERCREISAGGASADSYICCQCFDLHPNMASERLGKYLIVSKPLLNPVKEVWHPHCVVMWRDADGSHFHQFQNPSTFDTQEEAVLFGLTVARVWIRNQF